MIGERPIASGATLYRSSRTFGEMYSENRGNKVNSSFRTIFPYNQQQTLCKPPETPTQASTSSINDSGFSFI